jgi:hypothetical protein
MNHFHPCLVFCPTGPTPSAAPKEEAVHIAIVGRFDLVLPSNHKLTYDPKLQNLTGSQQNGQFMNGIFML